MMFLGVHGLLSSFVTFVCVCRLWGVCCTSGFSSSRWDAREANAATLPDAHAHGLPRTLIQTRSDPADPVTLSSGSALPLPQGQEIAEEPCVSLGARFTGAPLFVSWLLHLSQIREITNTALHGEARPTRSFTQGAGFPCLNVNTHKIQINCGRLLSWQEDTLNVFLVMFEW